MPKKPPVVGVRVFSNGNVWLVCKERGVGVLAGSRAQGLADMKSQLNEEFTIRAIEDRRERSK